MQIRMHIIEESRAEWREMPQDYEGCSKCWLNPHGSLCCKACGTLFDTEFSCGSIKEPRFHKNTNHMEPMDLYHQMCYDEIDRANAIDATGGSKTTLTAEQLAFIQEIREQAIIKILESGVHLCLKL